MVKKDFYKFNKEKLPVIKSEIEELWGKYTKLNEKVKSSKELTKSLSSQSITNSTNQRF